MQNAIKYFDKQENKLTIYSQDNGTNILLVIEDNGCGIKTSDLSRVFEKGFTGSNRNKANATGMGLYLSKKLCDDEYGNVYIVVDMELKGRIREALIKMILGFDIEDMDLEPEE